jgi:hypothetical protein
VQAQEPSLLISVRLDILPAVELLHQTQGQIITFPYTSLYGFEYWVLKRKSAPKSK